MATYIRRREFVVTLGSAAAAWPLAARAQQTEQMRRVSVIVTSTGLEGTARDTTFRISPEHPGWTEGRNVRIDTHLLTPAYNLQQDQKETKELVAQQPDVFVVQSTPFTTALQQHTRTVPIVFVSVSDPVGSGFVASLERPGGNLTGLMLFDDSVAGTWIGMLKQVTPRLQRVAVLHTDTTTFYPRAAQALAPSLEVKVVSSTVASAADIERDIQSFARTPNGGLLIAPDATLANHRKLIIALAAKHRLPAVYPDRAFVTDGGLMCYGSDRIDQFRQAAAYVDRILRGDKPADLPVQAPTKYETVVNLRTAKALGLVVPSGLLVAADDVIE